MERFDCETVTDTIARAMENAEKMKSVVILYESVEGEKSAGGIITQGNMTLATLNYLLDLGKRWIFE
jgi:hypothetical protein